MHAEREFPVMGSWGHVLVVGGPSGLADVAVTRLAQLESRWSRFRPDSELSRLNAAAGAPCVVSADTVTLVEALTDAWRRTAGRFDPTVHDALVALGYDTSFEGVEGRGRGGHRTARLPGCSAVRFRSDRGLVQLPVGVHLDPGGLGKGLAADLVAAEVLAAGADGVLVNVGGDLRVAGSPPDAEAWSVDVDPPVAGGDRLAVVHLAAGGIATSTSARRRWTTADGTSVHHLLDPATGRPAAVPRRQVTAVAGTAWWAEVAAKVAFLDGTLTTGAEAALVVTEDEQTCLLGQSARTWFALPPSSSPAHASL